MLVPLKRPKLVVVIDSPPPPTPIRATRRANVQVAGTRSHSPAHSISQMNRNFKLAENTRRQPGEGERVLSGSKLWKRSDHV